MFIFKVINSYMWISAFCRKALAFSEFLLLVTLNAYENKCDIHLRGVSDSQSICEAGQCEKEWLLESQRESTSFSDLVRLGKQYYFAISCDKVLGGMGNNLEISEPVKLAMSFLDFPEKWDTSP